MLVHMVSTWPQVLVVELIFVSFYLMEGVDWSEVKNLSAAPAFSPFIFSGSTSRARRL